MPLYYLRRLTGNQRTESANRHLARYLAFIAGAANAGGFLAVRQYTSHMSGVVAAMADNLALGSISLALSGLAAVLAFLMGAFTTTLGIRWAREHKLASEYALPLLAEAALLTIFGIVGREFSGGRVLGTVMLLCFTMGLQNAIITKLSNHVIRTTHLTGMVTDIGIELGRMVFTKLRGKDELLTRELMAQEMRSARLLGSLVVLFFVGGVVGALGFKHAGFLFTLPLSAILVVLAAMPVFDDVADAWARPRASS